MLSPLVHERQNATVTSREGTQCILNVSMLREERGEERRRSYAESGRV